MAGDKNKNFQRLATNPWAFGPVRKPLLGIVLIWIVYLMVALLGAAALSRNTGMAQSMRMLSEAMLGVALLVTLVCLWLAAQRSALPGTGVAVPALLAALTGRFELAGILLLLAAVLAGRFAYSAWRDNRLSYALTRQVSTLLLQVRPSLRQSLAPAAPAATPEGPVTPATSDAHAARS